MTEHAWCPTHGHARTGMLHGRAYCYTCMGFVDQLPRGGYGPAEVLVWKRDATFGKFYVASVTVEDATREGWERVKY